MQVYGNESEPDYYAFTVYQRSREVSARTNILPSNNWAVLRPFPDTDITTELHSFMTENEVAFVLGNKSFDEWDAYIEQMMNLGYREELEFYQKELEFMESLNK